MSTGLPAIILAGGKGTRLGELTQSRPKSMVPVNGLPFIHWQLNLLKRNGFSDVLLCLGHLGDQVIDYVQTGKKFGLKVEYSLDGEKPLGTGGALFKAMGILEQDSAVLYGDSYLAFDYSEILSLSYLSENLALMAICKCTSTFERPNVEYYNSIICNYSKVEESKKMKHIDAGLTLIKYSLTEFYNSKDFSDLSNLYKVLAENGQLGGYDIGVRYFEVGSKIGISELEAHLKGVE